MCLPADLACTLVTRMVVVAPTLGSKSKGKSHEEESDGAHGWSVRAVAMY